MLVSAKSVPAAPGRSLLAGLLLVTAIALAALLLADTEPFRRAGLGALALAILIGIALGNSVFPRIAPYCHRGVDLARSRLLRIGIVLFGFRISAEALLQVGLSGLLIDLVVVVGIFSLASWAGPRWFGLDRQSAMLIGAGSAICGAAAVVACEPVLRAPAHKVSVAVATVVVFGTLSMLLYPWLQSWLQLPPEVYALYVGSTVHEVAQVVVAGAAVSEQVAALIEKMLRVILLAPFLLVLTWWLYRGRPQLPDGGRQRLPIPWFALGFLLVIALNSLLRLPPALVEHLVSLDNALLAMAMAALGLRTHHGAIRQAGPGPLLLAAMLFVVLVIGGGALNVWLLGALH